MMNGFQSTHSLRSATFCTDIDRGKQGFQSTHSLRSATGRSEIAPTQTKFQSTHSLRSATFTLILLRRGDSVSIHALLAECDPGFRPVASVAYCFNPRTPCGVRLPAFPPYSGPYGVSIHALLAECDLFGTVYLSDDSGFNPRTPCGVRLVALLCITVIIRFNPRTPCGVRRFYKGLLWTLSRFQSTHSLRSATFSEF